MQALRAVNQSIESIITEWKGYRKRTIDEGFGWGTHIAVIPGTRSVDLECRTRALLVVNKIEQHIGVLESTLEVNRRKLDDIITLRDGVSSPCEFISISLLYFNVDFLQHIQQS